MMAVKTAVNQPEEKNAQRDAGEKGQACYSVERRGISSEVALRHLSCSLLPVQSVKDHTGGETSLRGVGPRGQALKTIRIKGAHGSPHKLPF